MDQKLVDEKLVELRNAFNAESNENGSQESNVSDLIENREELLNKINENILNYNLYQTPTVDHMNDLADNGCLISIDEIVNSFTSDIINDSERVDYLGLLKSYYSSIKVNAYDFCNRFKQTKYSDFIKEYFKNGIDCIKKDKVDIKVNELLSSDVVMEVKEQPAFMKGNSVYTDNGVEDFEPKYKFTNNADPIEFGNLTLKSPNDWFLYKIKTADYSQVESVDFIYTSDRNMLIFRCIEERIQIIYNGVIKADFQFIEVVVANSEVPLKILLSGELNRYVEASLAASTLNEENIEYSPSDNIFDTMRLVGMTKYEQIGYLCKYLPTLDTISDEYLRVNYQLLNKFKNGVPDEICSIFNLDKDNRVESLRDMMDTIYEQIIDSEDAKLISYYYTCKLFLDIIDEEISCGAFRNSSLMPKTNSFGFYSMALYNVMKSKNLKTFDEILDFVKSNNMRINSKKDNFKKIANIWEYYTILDYYARYSRKFLFLKSIIREPSFLPAQEQYDFGFTCDIIPVYTEGARKTKSDSEYRECDMTILFSYMSQSYTEAIKNIPGLDNNMRTLLMVNSYLPCYYFLTSMYYQLSEIVPMRDSRLPVILGKMDDGSGNSEIVFNLKNIDLSILDFTVTFKVPSNLLKQAIDNLNKFIIRKNSYIGITDYLKLQYKYNKSVMTPEFVVCNANIDYHKIVIKEKFSKINSYTMMQTDIVKSLDSSELFILGKESYVTVREFMSAGPKPYNQLNGDQMEAVDNINDVLAGIAVPGFTEGIIPPQCFYNIFGRQMLENKIAYNHTLTPFDYSNQDMWMALEYDNVVQEPACDYEQKKDRQSIAFASFELPTKSVVLKENTLRNIINYRSVNIDSLLSYIKENKLVIRLNSFSVLNDNDVKYMFDKELLSKIGFKINDDRYLIQLGVDIWLIILKEEVYV